MRFLILLVLFGCTTLSESEMAERDYDRSVEAEKWEECKRVYRNHSRPTVSRHRHQRGTSHRPHEVKQDMWDNNCYVILKRMGWD